MRAGQPIWVVDASVGIKLFVPEEYSSEVLSFFKPSSSDEPDDIFVPDLFYAECANILWKYVHRVGYPFSEAKKDIAELKKINLITVSSVQLMEKALELALEWDITTYDACYLALADQLKAPLLTADEKLLKRVKARHLRMVWIGDFKG
jgi:predicted nucleic acid-binding protein